MVEKRNAHIVLCLWSEKNDICSRLWDESKNSWRSAVPKMTRIDMTVFLFPLMQSSSSRDTGAVSDWWPGLKLSSQVVLGRGVFYYFIEHLA